MSVSKVKINLPGINEIMTGPAAQKAVHDAAAKIRSAAGDGFVVENRPHRYTARAYIVAKTRRARNREARDRVLSRAIDAAR